VRYCRATLITFLICLCCWLPTGCRPQEGVSVETPQESGSTETPSQEAGSTEAPSHEDASVEVPFAVRLDHPAAPGGGTNTRKTTAYLGHWQPDQATLRFDDTPLYEREIRASAPEYRISTTMCWDGGRRLVLNACLSGVSLEITQTHPDYRLERLEPPVDSFPLVLAAPSGDDLTLAAYPASAEAIALLEKRRGNAAETIGLTPPVTEQGTITMLVPLYVGLDGEDPLILAWCQTAATEGEDQARLFLARSTPDDRVSWREVESPEVPDLSGRIDHAEPNVVRLGSSLYLVAGRQVVAVDVESARPRTARAINEYLRQCVTHLETADYLFVRLGAFDPYVIVTCGGPPDDPGEVVAFVDDKPVGRLTVTVQGLKALHPDGEIGTEVAWPVPATRRPSPRFPNTLSH